MPPLRPPPSPQPPPPPWPPPPPPLCRRFCRHKNEDYTYDENGNLTEDLNKDITAITYNHQDLPLTVTEGTSSINNLYDADGNLLEKTVTQLGVPPVTYRYWGPYVYKDANLLYTLHEEGRSRYVA